MSSLNLEAPKLKGESPRILSWLNRIYAWVTGTQWYTPTLLNSWVAYGGGYAPPRYRKINGTVELQGLVKDGTATGGADLFILPRGFRPAGGTLIFTTMSNSAICRVDVTTAGVVEVQSGGSSTWISLTGIRFKAEQ